MLAEAKPANFAPGFKKEPKNQRCGCFRKDAPTRQRKIDIKDSPKPGIQAPIFNRY